MPNPPSAAQSLYPHLKAGTPESVEHRQGGSIAQAMYPRPQPKPQRPAPKSRLTREQAFDWSNVDPRFAQMVGLIPVGRR